MKLPINKTNVVPSLILGRSEVVDATKNRSNTISATDFMNDLGKADYKEIR
jgi:predicted urease superfamily metal-dependent hydrolase